MCTFDNFVQTFLKEKIDRKTFLFLFYKKTYNFKIYHEILQINERNILFLKFVCMNKITISSYIPIISIHIKLRW